MAKKYKDECVMRSTGTDLYIVYRGKEIAKRGHPDTSHAKQWISIEPGYTVHDTKDGITIKFNDVLVN